MNKINTLAAILFALFLGGCGNNDVVVDKNINKLFRDVNELSGSVNSMINVINRQNRIIEALNARIDELESLQVVYEEEEDCPPVVITPPKKATPAKKPEKASTSLQSRFKADRLNVVVFKEDWCPHCRRYLAAIKDWNDPTLNFVVVDTAKEPELAKLKRKNGIPETQVFSGAGTFLTMESGFSNKEDFQKLFNKYQPKRTQL